MFKNEKFWHVVMMPGAVAGWIFIVYGFLFPIQDENLRMVWMAVAFLWGDAHLRARFARSGTFHQSDRHQHGCLRVVLDCCQPVAHHQLLKRPCRPLARP